MGYKSASEFQDSLLEKHSPAIADCAFKLFNELQPIASSDNKLAAAIEHFLNKGVSISELENCVLFAIKK